MEPYLPVLKAQAVNWLDGVIGLLLPRRCPVCGNTLADGTRGWCKSCEAGMNAYDRPVCPSCRRFLKPGSDACELDHDGARPAIVHALGAFDGAFGVMAHAIKYDGFRDLARPLGEHLGRFTADAGRDLVVAIPTSPKKRRKRGFGHAEEIARACAHALSLPFEPDALGFTRRVADQTRLNATQRKANMHEALQVASGQSVTGCHVLIVDDVMTTGATMAEAARALTAAGAASVVGAVVALNLSLQT